MHKDLYSSGWSGVRYYWIVIKKGDNYAVYDPFQ